MLEIVLLGLNHKTAPVKVRECLAFSSDETDLALRQLIEQPEIEESLLFSTCNRIELLMAAKNGDAAEKAAKHFIGEFKKVPVSQFEPSLYRHRGDEATRHTFRVASSLDSMVVGEPQILGQMKESYRIAALLKASGVVLNRMMHRAFFVAKRVRTETGIGDNAVSISYAAIELGKKIFGSLEGKKVLLIGAGEMAELAVEHLIRNRSGDIFVANRTFERGVELAAKFKGTAFKFEEISDCMELVDIIISSTGATDFVITKEQVKAAMKKRRNRPIFFIDIAVPRDIDPKINRITNSYVYDIDDLKGVVDENMEDRNKEALKAERIVDEAVIRFHQWHETLDVVPTIVALREKLTETAERELARTLQSLSHLSTADKEAVRRMSGALVNKILHDPTFYLKRDGCLGNKSVSLDITRKLFNLDSE